MRYYDVVDHGDDDDDRDGDHKYRIVVVNLQFTLGKLNSVLSSKHKEIKVLLLLSRPPYLSILLLLLLLLASYMSYSASRSKNRASYRNGLMN
jgi:hypothetical protein